MFVLYCDGFSFTGSADEPIHASPPSNKTAWFRGANNLQAVFMELNASHGLEKAKRVIISGNSAGGLTVYAHLDKMRSMVSQHANVLGFPDGGYFLDAPAAFTGEHMYRKLMQVSRHQVLRHLSYLSLQLCFTRESTCLQL